MSEDDQPPEQSWRPLSRRDDPSYESDLFEGIPVHLRQSVDDWLSDAVRSLGSGIGSTSQAVYNRLERVLRLPGDTDGQMLTILLDAYPEQSLDVIDALVRWTAAAYDDTPQHKQKDRQFLVDRVVEMSHLLHEGGSAWKVAELPGGGFGLQRRVTEAVAIAAEAQMSGDTSANRHLRFAWHHLYGRSPDPSQALDEAVKAIEAAGKPVISPTNSKATLGTMIADLRNKPEKWATSIGTVDQLRERLAAIWTVQPRHGTDDPNAVVDVPQDVAEAAVHDALSIVHGFERRLIRLVS